MVKKISEIEFKEVKEAKMALVDFSATWCMPCKMLEPVLEQVSEELKDSVSFYNVDVDEDVELAQSFGVTSIPALIIIKDGEKKDMQVGFQPKDAIVDFIKSNM